MRVSKYSVSKYTFNRNGVFEQKIVAQSVKASASGPYRVEGHWFDSRLAVTFYLPGNGSVCSLILTVTSSHTSLNFEDGQDEERKACRLNIYKLIILLII